ncbi:response regulator transcription factor [Modestobacter sp. L9-4]|uniref:response regulator transcription factor n=1 Tax=Modestobacter sp. L9-4 TaxID=2851567 RepID=UPI001F3CEAA6|nr:helix-turn-helix transcriptional regulator [Modestobacter sp. L9-4]
MQPHTTGELSLAETATSCGSTVERAQGMLEALRRVVPFDGAWLALTDPLGAGYHSLASAHLDAPVVQFLAGPQMARDIAATGADRASPPISPSDLPYPVDELLTWADCLLPSGVREALALGLFTPTGRHVGFLALLSGDLKPPSPAVRRVVRQVAPVLAHGIDPMRSLSTAARLVRRARAGVVLCADGGCRPLPGLPGDEFLAPGSPVLAAVRERVHDGDVCASFLWPVGGRHAPHGHVRVTALAAPEDVPSALVGLALLSPPPDMRGLTPRELEVLGLLVEGCSNAEIARSLVVAPRTVAAHLEHVLAKLDAPTRTLAAVRAEREGLYVPFPRGRPETTVHPADAT